MIASEEAVLRVYGPLPVLPELGAIGALDVVWRGLPEGRLFTSPALLDVRSVSWKGGVALVAGVPTGTGGRETFLAFNTSAESWLLVLESEDPAPSWAEQAGVLDSFTPRSPVASLLPTEPPSSLAGDGWFVDSNRYVDLELAFAFEPPAPWVVLAGTELWALGPGAISGAARDGGGSKAAVRLDYSQGSARPVLEGDSTEELTGALRSLDLVALEAARAQRDELLARGLDARPHFARTWALRSNRWYSATSGVSWEAEGSGWRPYSARRALLQSASSFMAVHPASGSTVQIWPIEPGEPTTPEQQLPHAVGLYRQAPRPWLPELEEPSDASDESMATSRVQAPPRLREGVGASVRVRGFKHRVVRLDYGGASIIVTVFPNPDGTAAGVALMSPSGPEARRRAREVFGGLRPFSAEEGFVEGTWRQPLLGAEIELSPAAWECRTTGDSDGRGRLTRRLECAGPTGVLVLLVEGAPSGRWSGIDLDRLAGSALVNLDAPDSWAQRAFALREGQVVALLAWKGEDAAAFDHLKSTLTLE